MLVTKKLQPETDLLLIYGVTIASSTLGVEWLFQAVEKYVFLSVRGVIIQIGFVIALFLFVHTKQDVVVYGVLATAVSVLSAAVNLVVVSKYLSAKVFAFAAVQKHFVPIVTMSAIQVSVTFYANLNVVMLGLICGNQAVGYYSVAYKFVFILQSLVGAFVQVLLPRSSYYIQNGFSEDFARLLRKALAIILIIGLPSTGLIILLSREIILVFAGEQYMVSIGVLQIIVVNTVITYINYVVGMQFLIPLREDRKVLVSFVVGAVANLALNVLLFPRLSSVGAGITYVLTELVVCISLVSLSWKSLAPIVKKINVGAYLILAVLVLPLTQGLKYLIGGTAGRIVVIPVVAFVLYVGALVLLRDEATRRLFGSARTSSPEVRVIREQSPSAANRGAEGGGVWLCP